MPGRRELHFDRLADVIPEVKRLLAGHETLGNWSLAQICRHLSVALRLSTVAAHRAARSPLADPVARAEQREANRANRALVLDRALIRRGLPTPSPALDPPEGLDARDEADALRGAIEEFAAAPPSSVDHPLLGPLDPAEWERFHCVHCAHHLRFAVPQ